MNKIEFYFRDQPISRHIEIWCYQDRPDGPYRAEAGEHGLEFVKCDVTAYDEKGWLVSLPKEVFSQLAIAMSESLAQQGYKTKNENYFEGQIAAMKENLLDVRMMATQLIEVIKNK